jgi:hypothetical protein
MSDASGSPLSDGAGHAARQVAEVAAVLAMAAQGAARVRERQWAADQAGRQRIATAADPALSGAAAAARAASGEERSAAAAGFATPDVPATRVDEHHQGVAAGIGHAELADTDAGRAAALAAAAYPRPIGDALSLTPRPARPGQPVQLRQGRYR